MKIILAHSVFEVIGGDGFFFRETGRVLEMNGHQVAYFSTNQEGDSESKWQNYFGESANYQTGSLLQKIARFPKMVYSKTNKLQFEKLLIDFKPDIVQCFSIHTKITPSILEACSKYEVPTLIMCNDYKHICPSYKLYHHGKICFDCKNGNYGYAVKNRCSKNSIIWSTAVAIEATINNSLLNLYRKNIHTFLFSCDFMVAKTHEFWSGTEFRYDILKNPFDSPSVQYSENFKNYFLYFGRIIDEKGVDQLIRTMQDVPSNMKLIVVGDGPQLDECKNIVLENSMENVEFVGPKWGKELDYYLNNCRFVIVPSLWHEVFPYVVLQAFAAGKPVIGANRGGLPEMIKHNEFGFIYEPNEPQELVNYIKELWNNPSKALLYGLNAKKDTDKNFNDTTFYNQLIRIYSKVLSIEIPITET